ncbi:MAG: hypothetical protein LBT00_04000, partial [Spirochaetaceae bacterium]|nr:hypothetical protein [Spirochaetaceae bacterium]
MDNDRKGASRSHTPRIFHLPFSIFHSREARAPLLTTISVPCYTSYPHGSMGRAYFMTSWRTMQKVKKAGKGAKRGVQGRLRAVSG